MQSLLATLHYLLPPPSFFDSSPSRKPPGNSYFFELPHPSQIAKLLPDVSHSFHVLTEHAPDLCTVTENVPEFQFQNYCILYIPWLHTHSSSLALVYVCELWIAGRMQNYYHKFLPPYIVFKLLIHLQSGLLVQHNSPFFLIPFINLLTSCCSDCCSNCTKPLTPECCK